MSLVTDVSAPACPTYTRLYEAGGVVAERFGADQIPRLMRDHPKAVLWLDLFDPDENDLRASPPSSGCIPWPSRTPCTTISGPRSIVTPTTFS